MSDNTGLHPIAPHEAAEMIGIGVHSVRRWCEWHRQHLSAMANPGSGASRRLTRRDVEVLKTVKVLREQGLQTATINERLGGMAFVDVDIEEQAAIIESPQDAQDRPATHEGALVVVEALQSVVAPLSARVDEHSARMDEQGARLQALERQRLRIDVVFIALAAFIAGLVIASAWAWFR